MSRAARKSNVVQLKLVDEGPSPQSEDTVAVLERLLDDARKGRVIGLAYTAQLAKRGYIVDVAGDAARNPTFALGMVSMLANKLQRKVAEKS